MKEDYVTCDIAVLLKEKGYPQQTSGRYNMIGACYFRSVRFYEDGCIAPVECCYSAPTISQVLKWLREEKGIYMYIERDTYHLKFRYVFERDKPRGKTTSSIYETYEIAALAGIEMVLNNLI